jgi:7-cyano-7-deazaguanine synthase
MSQKTLLIYSGGMDSAVALYWLKFIGRDVSALGIDYGQRHKKELRYAAELADSLHVPYEIADLSKLAALLPGSSQTDQNVPVPEGHYEEESMKLTVVPNRNMIMLAVAAGHAMAIGAETVVFAAHAGDHAIYPDCREEFALALDKAIQLADWKHCRLERPFIGYSKRTIGQIGQLLGVDFTRTWSCYKGGSRHCGKCGTCTERREALAGFDPTEYEQPELTLK